MANLGDHLYISPHPQAILSVYNPARPYANPRDLDRIDDLSYRPRSTLTGPLAACGRHPCPTSRWGVPLSWYDPTSGERHAYCIVAGGVSCYTLA